MGIKITDFLKPNSFVSRCVGACENLQQFSIRLQGVSSFGFPGQAHLNLELESQECHGSLEKYRN